MNQMNIIIIDDDKDICKSLEVILSKDESINVLAIGYNGKQAIEKYFEYLPDILLMDIRMPIKSGIEAAKEILSRDNNAKILFLSTFYDDEYIINSLKLGVKGYIIKEEYDKVIPALKSVMNNQMVFADEVITRIPSFIEKNNYIKENQKDSLTSQYNLNEKEIKIMKLITMGYSNKEIAKDMHFSSGTIRNYISIILEKVNLKNRTQLALFYSDVFDKVDFFKDMY